MKRAISSFDTQGPGPASLCATVVAMVSRKACASGFLVTRSKTKMLKQQYQKLSGPQRRLDFRFPSLDLSVQTAGERSLRQTQASLSNAGQGASAAQPKQD